MTQHRFARIGLLLAAIGLSAVPALVQTAHAQDKQAAASAPQETVRKDMVLSLEQMGIEVEASHHEVAIGQHEIDFEYGDALATADRTVTMKSVLKALW